MLKKEQKEQEKHVMRRYEPPKLMLLGEVDKGLGYDCAVGDGAFAPCTTGLIATCVGGSWDSGTSCSDGLSAVLGGCRGGLGNTIPY